MKAFELFATLGLDSGPFAKGLNAAENLGSKFGSGVAKASKFVAGAIGAATVAVGGFATSSVKTGMEFDSAMSQVAATMGFSTDEIAKDGSETAKTFNTLKDLALRMGKETKFTITDAANALNYMALAGYDAEKSTKMLPTVLSLAAAGNMDLAKASDMVTDAQSALGLTMDDTTKFVDQMAKTASTTNTSVEQLGEAILTIGPTAKYMAGGTDRLNTVLGILADSGIKGSEAGTHLRNMLLKLSSPTKEGEKLLKKFGKTLGHDLVFDKKTGEMRDMQDIMLDLDKAMSGMTTEQKMKAMSELFNARDIAAVNILLGTNKTKWDEVGKAIADSAGAAKDMQETQLNNLSGDVEKFKSALAVAKYTVSEQLTPALREFVQFGTKGVSELTQAFSEGGLSGMMGKFGELLAEGLKKLVEFMPSAVEAGVALLESIVSGIVDNLPMIGEAFLQVLPILKDAGIRMMATVISGVTSVNTDEIYTKLSDAFGRIEKAIEPVITAIQNFVSNEDVAKAASDLLSGAFDLLVGAIELIASVVATAIEKLGEFIGWLQGGSPEADTFKAAIMGIIVALGVYKGIMVTVEAVTKAVEIAQALLNGTMAANPIGLVIAVIAGLVAAIVTLWNENEDFRKAVQEIWEDIKSAFVRAWEAIKQAWEAVGEWFASIWEAISLAFSAVVEFFTQIFTDAWTAIQTAWEGVVEWFTTLWTNISGAFASVVEFFSKLFGQAWTAITGALRGAVKWFTDLWSNISAAFDGVVAFFTQIFSDAWAAIETAWSTVSQFFSGIWDGVKAIFDPVVQWFDKTFGDAWGKIKGVFSGVKNWFKTNVFDKITGVFGSIGDSFWNIGENILTGLWNGIQAAWAWVKEKIEGIAGWVLSIFGVSLDIHSPSRKMRDKIGKNIMLGLAEGMTQNLGVVEDATEKTLGALPNPDSRRFRYQVQENFTASMGGITDRMGDMFSNFEQTVVLKLNDRELGRAVRGYV